MSEHQNAMDAESLRLWYVCGGAKVTGVLTGLFLMFLFWRNRRRASNGDQVAAQTMILPCYEPIVWMLVVVLSIEFTFQTLGVYNVVAMPQWFTWGIYNCTRNGFTMYFLQKSVCKRAFVRAGLGIFAWLVFGAAMGYWLDVADDEVPTFVYYGLALTFHATIIVGLIKGRDAVWPYAWYMATHSVLWIIYNLIYYDHLPHKVSTNVYYPLLVAIGLVEIPLGFVWYTIMRWDTNYWRMGCLEIKMLSHHPVLHRLEVGLLHDSPDHILSDALPRLIDHNRSIVVDFAHIDFSKSKLLASGGFSRVFTAQYKGKTVAVKFFLRLMELTAETIAVYGREVHAAKLLNHPNIVTFHGLCVRPPAIFLVLELCEGGCLNDFLAAPHNQNLSYKRILELAIECTRAVAYTHSIGYIHRDLKSFNVLMTKEGHCKLTDFGLSRLMSMADGEQLKPEPDLPSSFSRKKQPTITSISTTKTVISSTVTDMMKKQQKHGHISINHHHNINDGGDDEHILAIVPETTDYDSGDEKNKKNKKNSDSMKKGGGGEGGEKQNLLSAVAADNDHDYNDNGDDDDDYRSSNSNNSDNLLCDRVKSGVSTGEPDGYNGGGKNNNQNKNRNKDGNGKKKEKEEGKTYSNTSQGYTQEGVATDGAVAVANSGGGEGSHSQQPHDIRSCGSTLSNPNGGNNTHHLNSNEYGSGGSTGGGANISSADYYHSTSTSSRHDDDDVVEKAADGTANDVAMEKADGPKKSKVEVEIEIEGEVEKQQPKKVLVQIGNQSSFFEREYAAVATQYAPSMRRSKRDLTNHVGSRLWMAPEMSQSQNYTLSADVYSLGLLLWELTAKGQVPFEDAPMSQIPMMVSKGVRPEFSSDVPLPFQEIVRRAWSGLPANRPTARSILESLESLYAAESAGTQ